MNVTDDLFDIKEESPLKPSVLLSYLEKSPIANMIKLDITDQITKDLNSKEITKICKSLEKLLLEELSFEQLSGLIVASSITYLLSRNFHDFECRTELLHRTFRYSNTLDPVHLHVAAKSLHSNISSSSNLLLLCKNICFTSETGNAIAMCLVWAMFLESLGKEIKMYCFHQFSSILELVADLDFNQMLNNNDSDKVDLLFQLISILVCGIICRPNEELKKAGYAKYFNYERDDVQSLKNWAFKVNENIFITFNGGSVNFELVMAIKETIAYSIIALLDEELNN